MSTRNSTRVRAPAKYTGTDPARNDNITNDAPVLNRSRRIGVDEGQREVLMKCRRKIKVSTFNVRTLKNSSNIGELIACAEKYNIDIIGIQEHRIHHDDTDIKYHHLNKSWQNHIISNT